jgi:uncharacterized protein YbbC (DUF1343 family)/D-alanyl-D-alanine dipeptidase
MLARSITAAVLAVTCAAAADAVGQQPTTLPPQESVPATFADITRVAPGVVVEMRYFGDDNFVGRRIDGYDAPVCLLTRQAADALAAAQARLAPFGLGLKVFDCYRPARAVAHFVRWANDPADLLRKADYYPEIDKARLFELGYIAERSGHSRGSTVDLTIVDAATGAELDMGTGWDLFSTLSWPAEPSMTAVQRAHRLLLRTLMLQHGFQPYDKEWWHFTLRREPYPATWFDFPVARERAAASAYHPGVETFLADLPHRLRGARVALLSNHGAVDRAGTLVIDRIAEHPELTLVALLAPEHGIRANIADGQAIADDVDAKTGVPIHSLYGSPNRGPTPEMLENVDVLIYDLPEVGGRTWTYVSAMVYAMQAAARKGIPFVVLDRANPIGGEIVEGALVAPGYTSTVGIYPIPARHGMTIGELATMFNSEHGINVDLIVAPAANWSRSQWFEDLGMPWVNPSPNLRSPAALKNYPGTVYFEGTNISEGRGTDRPFEQIGASWLDAAAVVRSMSDMQLPGIRFEAVTLPMEPTSRKFAGQDIPGIRLHITDRETYRPVRTALLLIDAIYRQHAEHFAWTGTINRLTGSDRVRHAVESGQLTALLADWDREAAEFAAYRRAFLLYP